MEFTVQAKQMEKVLEFIKVTEANNKPITPAELKYVGTVFDKSNSNSSKNEDITDIMLKNSKAAKELEMIKKALEKPIKKAEPKFGKA